MKKVISFLGILIAIFFLVDHYLVLKTGCYIEYGSTIYLDKLICHNRVIVDGGYLESKIIDNELVISGVDIYYNFPKVCYTKKQSFYIYNYKTRKLDIFNLSDFIRLNNLKYHLPIDFYTLPNKYLFDYANNCF